MAEEYDMHAHMKRSMRSSVDAHKQGHMDYDELIDMLSVHALEYHNVMLRRLIDQSNAHMAKEINDGTQAEG